MAINGINANENLNYQVANPAPKKEEVQAVEKKEKDVFGEAAVYEKNNEGTVKAKDDAVQKADKFTKGDRTAIVKQLQADAEKRKNDLFEIVKKTIAGQGNAFALATEDDMWKFLASGDFTVDAETGTG